MRGRKTVGGSLFALLIGCGSTADWSDPPERNELGKTQSRLLISTNELYPSGMRTIDVCFTNNFGRDLVAWANGQTWERESAMAFNYVGDCNGSNASTAVKVRVVDNFAVFTTPDDNCGLDSGGDAAGTHNAVGVSLMGTGLEVAACTTDHITARGPARAFGFILGFREEIERRDRGGAPVCRWIYPPLPSGAQTVGEFDVGSVMNRCFSITGWPGLSASDIDGVQKVYGHPQPIAVLDTAGTNVTSMFVRGFDNQLWRNHSVGSTRAWYWHGGDLGGAPAVTTILGNPHVFVRMADGSLGQNWWTGSSWVWTNHGLGPGGGIKGKPAVISQGAEVRVFVRGADDALYQYWWNGGVWAWSRVADWVDSDATVVSTAPNLFNVFVNEGVGIRELFWDGVRWTDTRHHSALVDEEAWIRGTPQATALANGDIRVLVSGWDGSLAELNRHSGTWQWVQHGGLLRGIPAIEGPTSIWVRGVDDRLWQRWWTGSSWQWTKHDGVIVTSSPSAAPRPDGHVVWVRNGNGGISERVWNGSAWSWVDHPGNLMLP